MPVLTVDTLYFKNGLKMYFSVLPEPVPAVTVTVLSHTGRTEHNHVPQPQNSVCTREYMIKQGCKIRIYIIYCNNSFKRLWVHYDYMI